MSSPATRNPSGIGRNQAVESCVGSSIAAAGKPSSKQNPRLGPSAKGDRRPAIAIAFVTCRFHSWREAPPAAGREDMQYEVRGEARKTPATREQHEIDESGQPPKTKVPSPQHDQRRNDRKPRSHAQSRCAARRGSTGEQAQSRCQRICSVVIPCRAPASMAAARPRQNPRCIARQPAAAHRDQAMIAGVTRCRRCRTRQGAALPPPGRERTISNPKRATREWSAGYPDRKQWPRKRGLLAATPRAESPITSAAPTMPRDQQHSCKQRIAQHAWRLSYSRAIDSARRYRRPQHDPRRAYRVAPAPATSDI